MKILKRRNEQSSLEMNLGANFVNRSDYVYNDTGLTESPQLNRDPLYVVLPITVIYGAIFLTGIIGNISTCIVIARNKHMHTATNYYLFSLAISDLLLLLSGLPPEMYVMWRKHSYVFGETFCILQSFAAETSANATVLTITAFTIERYVAICHPFQSHTLSKLSRAVKFVFAIWLLALGLAVPQAIQYGIVVQIVSYDASPATYCTIKRILIENAFVISTCFFFVTPMTVITVLYVLIGVKLRRSRLISIKRPPSSVRGCDVSRHRTGTAQSHVIKMLVAVVVAFFICWAPFHAQRLMAMYFRSSIKPSDTVFIVYDFLTYISGVMYYLSTTINPLLYHIMSHKFREAFKSTLAQLFGWKRKKSVGKKATLYISLSKNDDRLACYNQNGRNIVSVHGLKSSSQRLPIKGKMEKTTQSGNHHGSSSLKRHRSLPAQTRKPFDMTTTLPANLSAVEPKMTKIADLQKDLSRSRGSSSASELTLMTSFGRIDDDSGLPDETILLHLQRGGSSKDGRAFLIKETDLDSGIRQTKHSHLRQKPKCTCLNCNRSRRGIASLTKRCLFKSKSPAPTFESLARKIRRLPNATRSKFARDLDRHVDGANNGNHKSRMAKTSSSNTISNSSLQDLDESEFTSSELADIMGQLKSGNEVYS